MSFTGAGAHPALGLASQKLLKTDQEQQAEVGKVGLSPRQQELDRRWAYYKCSQYAARKVAWDGSRVVGQTERDTIALAGYVPPGFYIANSETLPIQFRKPSTPYHLCRVIVDRFTGLLFGQKRHPKIEVKGDEDTEDFINAVVEVGRLWPTMMQARTYGGATGSVAIGFKVINGRPQFEVFDPRWCIPVFIDRANCVLSSIEYRYTFKQEIRDEDGDMQEVDFWYRRVIDTKQDVIFKPVIADPRQKPVWEPEVVVDHMLEFCPVVWVQNEPSSTEIDGEGDCAAVYDLSEAIDRLNAQAEKGILANCDPTTVIATDAVMGEVKKGSSNALKLPTGGQASYMEMSGGGVEQAREQAQHYKDLALEVAQCVLEQPAKPQTATEVDRNYAAMLARADIFREQYGEMGVKKLVNMVLVAAVSLTRPRVVNGSIMRYSINLPKKDDGSDHKLGMGPYQATLQWPPYFEPSLDDATKAVNAAGLAKQSGLVDQVHATKFVAPFFQVEDPAQHATELAKQALAEQTDIENEALAGAQPDQPVAPEAAAPEEQAKVADTALNGAQITSLAELIMSITNNQLPGEAAKILIQVGFPSFTSEQVQKMVDSAVSFRPSKKDMPAGSGPTGVPALPAAPGVPKPPAPEGAPQ